MTIARSHEGSGARRRDGPRCAVDLDASPLAWLWVASQMDAGRTPSMGAITVVVLGVCVTTLAIGKGLAVLNARYRDLHHTRATIRVHLPWLRSLRGERARETGSDSVELTVLDVMLISSVFLAAGRLRAVVRVPLDVADRPAHRAWLSAAGAAELARALAGRIEELVDRLEARHPEAIRAWFADRPELVQANRDFERDSILAELLVPGGRRAHAGGAAGRGRRADPDGRAARRAAAVPAVGLPQRPPGPVGGVDGPRRGAPGRGARAAAGPARRGRAVLLRLRGPHERPGHRGLHRASASGRPARPGAAPRAGGRRCCSTARTRRRRSSTTTSTARTSARSSGARTGRAPPRRWRPRWTAGRSSVAVDRGLWWAWLGGARPLGDALAARLAGWAPPDGTAVALGAEATGRAGFRATHRQAGAAHRAGQVQRRGADRVRRRGARGARRGRPGGGAGVRRPRARGARRRRRPLGDAAGHAARLVRPRAERGGDRGRARRP